MKKDTYLYWLLNTDVIPLGVSDRKPSKDMRDSPAGRIFCLDGESVSIQTGEGMYCIPRENYSPWSNVEAGFPSCVPPISWKEYAEEWSLPVLKRIRSFWRGILYSAQADYKYKKTGNKRINFLRGASRGFKREWHRLIAPIPCTTIYPYIPVECVEEFIYLHGGEDTESSFRNSRSRQ